MVESLCGRLHMRRQLPAHIQARKATCRQPSWSADSCKSAQGTGSKTRLCGTRGLTSHPAISCPRPGLGSTSNEQRPSSHQALLNSKQLQAVWLPKARFLHATGYPVSHHSKEPTTMLGARELARLPDTRGHFAQVSPRTEL